MVRTRWPKHRGRTQNVVTGSDLSEGEGADFSNVPELGKVLLVITLLVSQGGRRKLTSINFIFLPCPNKAGG